MTHKSLIINNLRNLLLLVGLWCLTVSVIAQNGVSFEASTNARQVILNSYFEVTFTLKSAKGSQFAPPSFKDFIVLAGPNMSTSMSILNGKVSQEVGYGFTLQPKKSGKFTIGSASISANGQTLRTAPISIEVLKESTGAARGSDGEKVFVRIEPSKKQAYLGEQILVDFKLYTQVGIEGYDIPQDPDYDGFYALELRRFNSNTVQEVVNGKQFATKILRRIALFPQQTGQLKLEPFQIQLGIVDDESRSNFFFGRNVKPLYFTTNGIEINVLPLPDGADESFCGAVGDFEIQAGIDRKTASTDDAVTFSLIVKGNGDLKRVQAPALMLSDSFEVYPPKLASDNSDEGQGEIIGERRYDYQILPKMTGDFVLTPRVSFFNTDSKRYKVVGLGPFSLEIKKGSGNRPSNSISQSNSGLNDILPIKTSAKFHLKSSGFTGSLWHYLLLLLPVLGFVALLFFRKKQRESEAIDPSIKKARAAGREAQKRLATARQFLETGNSRGFYDEISKAYLGYVCDKTGLLLSNFTKGNAQDTLLSLHVNPDTVENYVKILSTCEIALFAGMDNPTSMQTTYDEAIATITKIEEELNSNTGK